MGTWGWENESVLRLGPVVVRCGADVVELPSIQVSETGVVDMKRKDVIKALKENLEYSISLNGGNGVYGIPRISRAYERGLREAIDLLEERDE
jgi:hypothetical protein